VVGTPTVGTAVPVVVVPVATTVPVTTAVPVATAVPVLTAVPVVAAVAVMVPVAPAVAVVPGVTVGLGVTVWAIAAAPNITLATPRVAAALNHLLLIAVLFLLVLSALSYLGFMARAMRDTLQTSSVAYAGLKP
jgi:hypothetical protein